MPSTSPFEFRRIEQILAARLLASGVITDIPVLTSFDEVSLHEVRPRIELSLSVDAPTRFFKSSPNHPIAGGWQVPIAWSGTLTIDVVTDNVAETHEQLCGQLRYASTFLAFPLDNEDSHWVVDEVWPTGETPVWNSEENSLVTTVTYTVKWRIRQESIEDGG